ncbi:hypothetical protein QTP70_021690 [Hemibagrus guttatus]|uniref:Uncharacterized protein n=1 Tax=Hemibagrus guttatus TaxID=175788 RepID=A0AAE0RBC8_9TELE|nr:hypothetical protein QTP70_021690 [Hemibagrus guttatus]
MLMDTELFLFLLYRRNSCGVVLIHEDTPYLEILGIGEKREEERREEREEGEQERTEEREGHEEERREEREGEVERERKVEEKEKSREQREITEEEKREGREGEEERKVDAVEKQASLITLAWSKPANNNTQGVTSALPEAPVTEATSTESHTPDHTHSVPSLCEHTATAHTHTLVEPLQEPSSSSPVLLSLLHLHSSFSFPSHCLINTKPAEDVQNESSSDEHRTSSSSAVLQLDSGNTPASGETHTQDAACDAVCEEQQLQREATMRSLVHIQRRAEQRWQQDRDRQILRVQERLSIIQNRKSDEDLLGLRREETFRHLTNTLQKEDEQQQKMMVREKLQQMWRERSYVLQSRRERYKVPPNQEEFLNQERVTSDLKTKWPLKAKKKTLHTDAFAR